jgi:hypothetical protein
MHQRRNVSLRKNSSATSRKCRAPKSPSKLIQARKRFYELVSAISLDALIPQSRSIAPEVARKSLAEARIALREASSHTKNPDALWFIEKISWQPDYLDLALNLREAEVAKRSGTAERAAIEALVAKHIHDGTMLDRGYGYRSAD